MWRKSNETDFLFTNFFIVFRHQYYLLQSNSFNHHWKSSNDMVFSMSVSYTLFWIFSEVQKCHLTFFSHKHWEQVSRKLKNYRNAFLSQKFCDIEGNQRDHGGDPIYQQYLFSRECPFFWAFQRSLYKRLGWQFVIDD